MYTNSKLSKLKKSDLEKLVTEKGIETKDHISSGKPSKSFLIKLILSIQTVEAFNEKAPKKVLWRVHKSMEMKEYTTRSEAFVPRYGIDPAVFFEEQAGYCLITSDFCKF
jgi:hypothetical protein